MKSFTPRSRCKAAVRYSNVAFVQPPFRTLDNCPFTFIHTLTSGQYGPTNAKQSHTDLSTLYRQHRLLCRRKVREQKRQCVQEQRKERLRLRGISASVIDCDWAQCSMPSPAVKGSLLWVDLFLNICSELYLLR